MHYLYVVPAGDLNAARQVTNPDLGRREEGFT